MQVQKSIAKACKEKTTKFRKISENGYLHWMLQQNIFLRESKILYCLSKTKDSHLRNYLDVHSLSLHLNLITSLC